MKKREPNSSAPRLKNDGLKVELHNKLHGASIVGEGLCRIIEGTAVNANETSDAGISDRVDSVNTARNELRVVENVERLSGELNIRSLARVKALYNSHVPVVRAWGSQRIASGSCKGTRASLNVLGIGVLGNVTYSVTSSVFERGNGSSGTRYAVRIDDCAVRS